MEVKLNALRNGDDGSHQHVKLFLKGVRDRFR
jgi:hypothetical protein